MRKTKVFYKELCLEEISEDEQQMSGSSRMIYQRSMIPVWGFRTPAANELHHDELHPSETCSTLWFASLWRMIHLQQIMSRNKPQSSAKNDFSHFITPDGKRGLQGNKTETIQKQTSQKMKYRMCPVCKIYRNNKTATQPL